MEIRIRKAGIEDTESYLSFLHDIKDAMPQTQWFYLDPDEEVREMMEDGSMQLWFAETQDRIAGVFSIIVPDLAFFNLGYDLDFNVKMLTRVVHMDTAAVHPDFRGHNLQYRMMMAAEEELRKIGGRILLCTIHPDNRYSIQNVLKQGYTIQKKLEKYGGSIRYILRKDLPEGGKTMNTYEIQEISQLLAGNTYPGRGIILGKSADGKSAVAAYFIMGRSANSRNRILAEKDGSVFTEPFDASKVEDPSLIIYRAIRQYENNLIITNGNHTDTVYDGLASGISFDAALATREFEPDGPNWTPRISGMLTFEKGDFTYKMSILKSADAEGSACNRFGFHYASQAGSGHFLHTYQCDGNPIPSFQGEPKRVAVRNDINAFAEEIWNALDENNRISLYVRYIDLETGAYTSRLINKNV